MFRLYFNPKLGKWQVQFLKLGILWVSVSGAEFASLDAAREYVTSTGIDQAYDEWMERGRHAMYVMGIRQ